MLVRKRTLPTHVALAAGAALDLGEQGTGHPADRTEALSLLELRVKQVPLETKAEAVVGVDPEAELTVGVMGTLGVRVQGKPPLA